MKQPILKQTAFPYAYVTPDGRFMVEKIFLFGQSCNILERDEGGEWTVIATVGTLAEARRLVSKGKSSGEA